VSAARRRRRSTLALLALLLAALLGGCVSLPVSGPVQAGPSEEQPGEDTQPDYSPGGPKRGAGPVDIVRGFLQAMQATPLRTDVARQFLTSESSATWAPEKGTVVYSSFTPAALDGDVRVDLSGVDRLDGRGAWLGDPTHGKGLHYRLDLVREKGQWRISDPPDELVIPRTHFESRFSPYVLYFFDKSAQVLVPEPVYLPQGDQAPTLLVRGLLQGVDDALLGTERTFIPAGTELDLSVPVSDDGTAEVPVTDDVLDLSEDQLKLALTQFAATLQQVPGIERMRLTVDGSPVNLPGEGTDHPIDTWSEYAPSVNWASQELFAVRDERVVTLAQGEERHISGLFGSVDFDLRSIAVDLSAQWVAGVTHDGGEVLVARRTRSTSEPPSPDTAQVAYSGGVDVLKPAWDLYGQLWVLDRNDGDAELTVVHPGGGSREVSAPGITGHDVKAFVLSRDGTRLVADIAAKGGDRLTVARVRRDHTGLVRAVGLAQPLPVGGFDVQEIRDLAWRTPDSVALLTGPSPGLSQVIVARIDGSSALDDLATDAELFRDDAARIVTSPAPGAPLYVGTRGGLLFELSTNGRWTGSGFSGGLVSPTFVG
jgi:hypothetical protein